jgi:hypothetical protein
MVKFTWFEAPEKLLCFLAQRYVASPKTAGAM